MAPILVLREEEELSYSDAKLVTGAVSKVRDCVSRIATDHREQHSTVSKVGKAIDRVNFHLAPWHTL